MKPYLEDMTDGKGGAFALGIVLVWTPKAREYAIIVGRWAIGVKDAEKR